MKSMYLAAGLAALLGSAASAETIGVSMQSFDNNFQTLLREQDGLAAMAEGDLDATVFQNAKGQSACALDAAVALARGRAVEREVMVPFELVTPKNMADYTTRN